MKIRCWNCGTEEANLEASACGFCGELLRPDEAQRARAGERIDYLIRELKRWKSVPDWWKREAEENYRKRLFTLRELPSEGLVVQPPESKPAPAPPPPLTAPRFSRAADKAEAIQRLLDEQPYQQPPQEAPVAFEPHAPSEADVAMQMLMGAFSEKKIRLLYALGGVLLLAAAVGILGSNWEGWGRQAMGFLLTLLPVFFFWLAGQLKEKLPVSSRMFTVLGGGMLPIGLIFLNIFNAPSMLWNPIAFLVGWWVNRKNADEPICTYLSGLCWALAGWTTGSGLLLGLFSFAGAGLLFWKERDHLHWTRVGHGLAFLGLMSAFTRGHLETGPAMTLFLLAIVYFTTCALVLNTRNALIGSSLICLLCAGWLGSLLEWPASSVGLVALLQGALYIRRGETGQALAVYLTGGVLLLFLGLPLLINHQANLTQFITGALGAAFYGFSAYHYRKPNWAYGASLCSLYAYFCLLSLLQTPMYRPWLVAMVLLWQVAVTVLRNRVPEDYLRPWAFTAAGTALLLVPMNMALQMAGADVYTPWIYLGVSAVIALCAIFERESKALYVSMVTAALAYGTWLPVIFGQSSQPNLGLGFTAFVAALALLGLALKRTPYATPILVSAAIAGWAFSTMQLYYLFLGYWSSATAALIFYGVGFAIPRKRIPNIQAGLCLITALACIDHFGTMGLTLGLVACAAATLLPGYLEAALLWSAAVAVLGPMSFKLFPALLWLATAGRQGQQQLRLAQASAILTLPCLLFGLEGANIGLLALLCAGYLGLAQRWNESSLLALAWLGLKPVYGAALPENAWTIALWAEWALFFFVNRQLTHPAVAVEAMTGLTLLLASFWLGGWAAALNPWLVVLVLMLRGHQTGRQDLRPDRSRGGGLGRFRRSRSGSLLAGLPGRTLPLVLSGSHSAEKPQEHPGAGPAGLGRLPLSPRPHSPVPDPGFGRWRLRAGPPAPGQRGPYLSRLRSHLAHLRSHHSRTLHRAAGARLVADRPTAAATSGGFDGSTTALAGAQSGLGEHALWAGTLALGVLALGQATHRANYMAWGGLALLSEVAIQTVLFASNLPWHQWAVVGGLLLVDMAFLVERRRQEVASASRTFLQHLNAW